MRPDFSRPTRPTTVRVGFALALTVMMGSLGVANAAGAYESPSGTELPQAPGIGALADATVRVDRTDPLGGNPTLDADLSPEKRAYLLFDVQGLTAPVQQATLSLYLKQGPDATLDLRSVPNTTWGERTITWNNAPPPGPTISSWTLGATGRVSIDVTTAISGNGRVSFALLSPGKRATFWSREAGSTYAPSLTVTTATGPTPPVNTAPPALSGTAQVGQSLSTTNGSWSGTTPMTYAYQWRRCDSAGGSCSSISGATASSYALGSADVGATIRAQVTATNTAGSASASSAPSSVVQAAPPPPPPPGGGGGASRFGISGMTATLGSESTADFNRDMNTIDSTGTGWLRMDINWAVIQRNGSTSYDWAQFDRIVVDARARGLNVLGIIDYTPPWARPSGGDSNTPPKNVSDYANFAWTAVKRYSAMGVHAYEIWNEPNLGVNWKPAADATRYTELLKAAYTAIHQADPLATVVSGGLSPATSNGRDIDPRTFVQGMYASGAKGSFDALGHHPYCFPAAPGDAQGWSAWYQMYGTSTSLRSTMVANGDGDKKIWATEFGAATNGPSGAFVSEATQAQHITKAYELFGSYSWAGPLFAYSSRDSGTDPSTTYNFFGLTRYDFSLKPALAAYQAAAAAG